MIGYMNTYGSGSWNGNNNYNNNNNNQYGRCGGNQSGYNRQNNYQNSNDYQNCNNRGKVNYSYQNRCNSNQPELYGNYYSGGNNW